MSQYEMQRMVNAVHGRMFNYFPLGITEGWKYKGFEPEDVGGIGRVVILRFEKLIMSRTAYVEIQISEHSFNNPVFRLKDFIVENLRLKETELVLQRYEESDMPKVLQ